MDPTPPNGTFLENLVQVFTAPWSVYRKLGVFNHLVSFKLGNGQKITFWKDPWCLAQSFSHAFSNLFRIAGKAKFNAIWDSSTTSWSLFFRCAPKDEEVEEFQLLISGLQGKGISLASDSRAWSLDSSGTFSVKSLMKFLMASTTWQMHSASSMEI